MLKGIACIGRPSGTT